jgi:hypothetical protein
MYVRRVHARVNLNRMSPLCHVPFRACGLVSSFPHTLTQIQPPPVLACLTHRRTMTDHPPNQPSPIPPHTQKALQPEFISKVCPAVFGCVGYGAAMYELQPTGNSTTTTTTTTTIRGSTSRGGGSTSSTSSTSSDGGAAASGPFVVRRLWARDDVSCGTSIPLIAEGGQGQALTGGGGGSTTYCVGACSCSVCACFTFLRDVLGGGGVDGARPAR